MRGFHYTPADLRLHLLFQELQGLAVDRTAYGQFFGLDVVEEHAVVWEALGDFGWITVSDEHVTVLDDGVFYLPLIQKRAGARPPRADASEAGADHRVRACTGARPGGRRPGPGTATDVGCSVPAVLRVRRSSIAAGRAVLPVGPLDGGRHSENPLRRHDDRALDQLPVHQQDASPDGLVGLGDPLGPRHLIIVR